MKKNYQKPSITVVELENSCVLLAGSNPLPEGYEQVRFTGEDCDPAQYCVLVYAKWIYKISGIIINPYFAVVPRVYTPRQKGVQTLNYMVIFVIYISAFSSFISSAVIPVISMIDASSIPFASTSSWQFQGFAGTCLLPCLQLCLFPYLLPFLSGTCHPGGTGASWHQSQGLLSFLYRHQKTQKPQPYLLPRQNAGEVERQNAKG